MCPRRPIDRQRDGAITLNVGGSENSSPIKGFLSTGDNLYIIKEEGVFKVQLADDIDPERTNPEIPNLSQQVLSSGENSEVVARVLLTAQGLFDERRDVVNPFNGSFLEHSIELTRHVLELEEMVSALKEEIQQKEDGLQESEFQPNAVSLPSIPNLDGALHNILVKADKARDSILTFYRLCFFPDRQDKPALGEYDAKIEDELSLEPEIVTNWNERREVFTIIRNIRNASEHRRKGNQLLLNDFGMRADGGITPPIVEIQHKDTPIGPLSVVELVEFIHDQILGHAEASVVFVKCVRLMEDNPFSECIAEFGPEQRRHPMVRYYRAIDLNGALQILG